MGFLKHTVAIGRADLTQDCLRQLRLWPDRKPNRTAFPFHPSFERTIDAARNRGEAVGVSMRRKSPGLGGASLSGSKEISMSSQAVGGTKEHPITMTAARGRTRVTWKGAVIADSGGALEKPPGAHSPVIHTSNRDRKPPSPLLRLKVCIQS